MGVTRFRASTQIGHFYRLNDGRRLLLTFLVSTSMGGFREVTDYSLFGMWNKVTGSARSFFVLDQVMGLEECPDKEVKTVEEAVKIWGERVRPFIEEKS